jgi:hypothetical protein
MIDARTLEISSLVGSSLSVLGSLYLAYDLLGGQHGPLRTLTRAVTYGVLFGAGYGIAFGPIFGLVTGAAMGITLSWELSGFARRGQERGFWYDMAMSAIRGCGFAAGAGFFYGKIFGITFGALRTVGQIIGYRVGVLPSLDYSSSKRPRMTKHLLLAVIIRATGYAVAGYLSALVGPQRAGGLALGLKIGLLVGAVTAIVTFFLPFIEWAADSMPVKRMGVIGIGLILIGFALQSLQHWASLFGASIR